MKMGELMKRSLFSRVIVSVVLLCMGAGIQAGASAVEPDQSLTVCLNKDNAPFSFNKGSTEGGFDYLVAQSVARALGKTLVVRWYEKERRSRVPVSIKTSVMINAGICQLVGGYPLIQSSLGREAGADTTNLPPVAGLPAERREEMIKGSPLVAGPAYYFVGITPVFGAHVPPVALSGLDDLRTYKIGNRPSSIGDLISMAYKKGMLIPNVTHVDARLEPLEALERSEFDVTFTEAYKFDLYRAAHPQSTLRASGLMLPVGFNLGFVSTDANTLLLEEVGRAITRLLENGALHKAAAEAGLTYIGPEMPAVRSGLGLEKMTQ